MANRGELLIIQSFEAWEFFCTWTFKGQVPSYPVARKMVFAHLYRSADLLRVAFPRLVWAIRCERGEKGGRLHYHGLLGGTGKKHLGAAFALNHLWESYLPACGMARHRLFDVRQRGPEYILDCLSLKGRSGADAYEVGKFGGHGVELTLSESLRRSVGPRGSSATDYTHLSKNSHADKKGVKDGTPESKNELMQSGNEVFPRINREAMFDGGGVCGLPWRMVSVWVRGGHVVAQGYQ